VIAVKRITAVVLCILLLSLPVAGGPRPGDERAGQIDALIPAATRNDVTAKAKDDVDWNDLLKTAKSGRVRASLVDGSILSVGSSSELRVVQHDAATQQTSLEVDYGKLRSQVQKITKEGGKFQVKTPNAVIGAIGTDFYVAYLGHKTTVICYKGQVSVTPLGNVQIIRSGQTNSSSDSITVNEGQMVVVSTVLPPPSDTPPGVQQATLLATDVPSSPPIEVRPGAAGRARTWIFIGTAAAIGTAIGVVATRSYTHPATGTNPPTGTGPGCPSGSPAC
jgi:FecR protein